MTSSVPNRLGVTPRDGGIEVAVVSRHGERISICLFDDAGEKELHRVALTERMGDVHYGFIPGVEPGARYGLRAEGPWDPAHGHRFDPAKLLVDPYAMQIDRPFVHRAELALPPSNAVDTAAFVPKAIVSARPPPADRLPPQRPGFIYEIAIKAFTRLHPDIPETMRGTVAALAHPAAIEHLVKLGIDTVELMPVAAWIDERHLPALGLHNGWGYNPVVFMAPDPRLAPGGIDDLRAAVATLHEAGIRVLLDVVFNHSGESDALGTTLSLRGLDNALYYRHATDDPGRLVNDTGCGNTLALDRAPVVRLVMDAMRHWAESTGIDGFRFDLATVMGRTESGFSADAPLFVAIAQDPLLGAMTLIAEPWDVGPGGHRLGQFPPEFHEWNDRYRDDIRRFWRGDGNTLGALATRLAGSSDIFGHGHRRPSASINYVAAHDGFTLRDAVTHDRKHNEANGEDNRDGNDAEVSWTSRDPKADVRAMLATLFLSRGTPMLTAGDELGRTQKGNNNAYAQDNATTWLDWASADRALIDFVAELVRLRRAHPALTSDRFLTGETNADDVPDVAWLTPDGNPMSRENWDGHAVVAVLFAEDDRVAITINGGSPPSPRDGHTWVRELEVPGRLALHAERRSRAQGVSDETLRRLAQEAGIEQDWWEVDGTHHVVAPESLRAVLVARRLPASSISEAHESLAALAARKTRALPRTQILTANEGAVLAGPASRRRVFHIASEGGDVRKLEFAPGEALRLPPLPAGYHECWLEDEANTQCRLIVSPGSCYLPPVLAGDRRQFGFAAHLYALRRHGDQGIGDFETLARFGEWAAKAGAAACGINPLHHMFPADRERASPYQPSDRRFIDPIYIDVEGFGGNATVSSASRYVDYTGVWRAKLPILKAAFKKFTARPDRSFEAFEDFEENGDRALALHGLFETLAEKWGTKDRTRWPTGSELARFVETNQDGIHFRAWLQWVADKQFAQAAERARSAGLSVGFYRDLALGCAYDGGEVWANPESFADGVSIGAPPDPFARQGQVWNLPPNSPLALTDAGFDPFIAVLSANMRHAGALRIDHILGYARQFWVPRGAEGSAGAYVKFPTETLIAITAIESHRHRCAVIGEDLGTVPDGLRQSLAAANILSYRVLWFERDGLTFRPPASYPRLSASCLSSHDLPTFMGWRQSAAKDEIAALDEAIRREGIALDGSDEEALAAAHEFVARTPSVLMLVQVDDLEGETEPLNVPGTDRERPNWRRRNRGNIEDLDPKSPVIERVKRGRQA